MNYADKINKNKENFPFDQWRKYPEHGLDQYTPENCDKAQNILDNLLNNLVTSGEKAPLEEKLNHFQTAVEALNHLDDQTCLIETGEREQLCEVIDYIGISAGIDPHNYGSGDGIASEWREW